MTSDKIYAKNNLYLSNQGKRPHMLITENNRKWWILFAAGIVLVMTNIDFSAVNIALAPMAKDLHADLSTLQWIINGYSSAAAACVLIGGRLGDIYGYRKVFLFGVLIFAIASVFIGLAVGKWDIILFRIIQGAGGSICWPLCVVIVSNAFPDNRKGHAIGMSMAIAAIAVAGGPIFGGILLHFLSWRWIFFINIPLAILALILAFSLIPPPETTKRISLHLPSVLLILVSVFIIITALNEFQTWGFSSLLFQLLLWSGVLLLSIFIWLQKRINNPLLDLSLISKPILKICLTLRFLNQLILVSILFLFSLFLQNILNYSSLSTSLILSPLTIALGITSFVGGRYIDKYGSKNLIILGMFLCLIATFLLVLNATNNVYLFIFPFVLAGVGMGLNIPSLMIAILKNTNAENLGIIGGLSYASVFIGGSLATVICGWILQIRSTISIHKLELVFTNTINDEQLATIKAILSGANSIHNLSINNLVVWTQQAFLQSFSIIMWVCVMIAALSLVLACNIKK